MADVQTVYLSIEGTVSIPVTSIEGTISTVSENLSGALTLPTELPYYTGTYEVNPDFIGINLQTAGKALVQNININPIQVEDVSNPSGGRTVYIGGIN